MIRALGEGFGEGVKPRSSDSVEERKVNSAMAMRRNEGDEGVWFTGGKRTLN